MSDEGLDLSGFAAPDRKVDVAPPKKAPAKKKTTAQAGAKAAKRQAPRRSAPEPARRAGGGRKKRVNVSVPVELSIRFTETATREDRYLTDMVLDAYRNHFADLRSYMEAERAGNDLPFRPRRRKTASGRVTHMLYLASPEIAVIDASAIEVGISRSELVALLLERELG